MLASPDYAKAVHFAARAHAGQLRKGSDIPYITHPLSVSALVIEFGGDEEQAIAGLLHDVVEDCGVSLLTLAEEFGVRVAAIVEGCTDGVPDERGRKAPWRERKELYLEHLEETPADVLLVSACDKLHNARSIVSDIQTIGSAVFDRFTADRDQTIWYYRRLAGVFQRQLQNPRLVTLFEYEIASMTDFGISGDATAL
jgi:GTP pyrophosphokinase